MRHLLLGLITIGAVTTGVGLTGVIAPATDSARTGTVVKEFAETGQFPPLVDLQLAPLLGNSCGAFTDNLQTGRFNLDIGTDRFFSPTSAVMCVRNRGTVPSLLRVRTEDIVLSDPICTPDETYESNGQTLSGCNGADASGFSLRLGVWLGANFSDPSCPLEYLDIRMNGGEGTSVEAVSVSPMPAESVECVVQFVLSGPTPGLPDSAQTDRLEWRVRFSA